MQSHLLSMSEGLGEVFCLSDPSRDDNPVIFASEEFHRTTQYGHDFVIGRNCRFLQGPKTNSFSIKRIRDEIRADRPHCEAVLNYRRDGSPFMNLLMTAPLVDSMGKVRYYLGAQVDVSGLVKGNVGLPSLERLVSGNGLKRESPDGERADTRAADEFRGLSEMFNKFEIETVRNQGGKMHDTRPDDREQANWHRSRILIQDDMSHPNIDSLPNAIDASQGPLANGGLTGFYDHYLLVRRPPSLRILFVSPSLRKTALTFPRQYKADASASLQECPACCRVRSCHASAVQAACAKSCPRPSPTAPASRPRSAGSAAAIPTAVHVGYTALRCWASTARWAPGS